MALHSVQFVCSSILPGVCAIAEGVTDTSNRSKEVDKLLKRCEQLAKRIEKLKAIDPRA